MDWAAWSALRAPSGTAWLCTSRGKIENPGTMALTALMARIWGWLEIRQPLALQSDAKVV
jgi:hypothetical protein